MYMLNYVFLSDIEPIIISLRLLQVLNNIESVSILFIVFLVFGIASIQKIIKLIITKPLSKPKSKPKSLFNQPNKIISKNFCNKEEIKLIIIVIIKKIKI